jgi:hypothetical protein
MNQQNVLLIPAPIMEPIPPDMHLQVTLWITITGTFAKTNFFGGVTHFCGLLSLYSFCTFVPPSYTATPDFLLFL